MDPKLHAEMLERGKRHERKLQRFSDMVNDFYNLMKEDSFDEDNDPDHEYLVMEIAKFIEETGGEMPYSLCTLCGSTDDGHYNNNAECS